MLAIGGLLSCSLPGKAYPTAITVPDVIGLVQSATTTPDGTVQVQFRSGASIALGPNDRSLGGVGDQLFVGSQPSRWYLPGFADVNDDTCYTVTASRGWSEAGSVVLAFEQWPGAGVRLQKAPDFDERGRVADDDGHHAFSSLGSVGFCVDEAGRVRHPR